jgi:membrane associated rhomboid family serine protease
VQRRQAWPPLTSNLKITLGVLAVFWLATLQIVQPGSAGFVQELTGLTGEQFLNEYMLVSRETVLGEWRIWTLLTYAFWHTEYSHLLFNGLALWMFGGELDRQWDDAWFWGFCLLCALGSGIAIVLVQLLFGSSTPTIGYSGAIMGLAAAYCWYNWESPLYLFFLRIKGKWLLGLFVLFDFFLVGVAQEPISISGHLGGMITGLLLVTGYWRPRRLKRAVKRWKRQLSSDGPPHSPDRKTSNGQWIN